MRRELSNTQPGTDDPQIGVEDRIGGATQWRRYGPNLLHFPRINIIDIQRFLS